MTLRITNGFQVHQRLKNLMPPLKRIWLLSLSCWSKLWSRNLLEHPSWVVISWVLRLKHDLKITHLPDLSDPSSVYNTVLTFCSRHIAHSQFLPQVKRFSAHYQALGYNFSCSSNMWFPDVGPVVDFSSISYGNNVPLSLNIQSQLVWPLYLNATAVWYIIPELNFPALTSFMDLTSPSVESCHPTAPVTPDSSWPQAP